MATAPRDRIRTSTFAEGALGAPSIGDPNQVPNPHLLVGDQARNLFSLDRRSGAIVARFAAGGPISGSPPVGDPSLSDPCVAVGDGGGNIYAFDNVDAFPPPVWRAALGGPVDGPPVLANGFVYVATIPRSATRTCSPSTRPAAASCSWRRSPAGWPVSPIVADGRLVVATQSGDVVAYQSPDT